MSEPLDLPPREELLTAAGEILARMTPAEQAEARAEASAKGVSVEELLAKAVLQILRQAQEQGLGDRRAKAAAAELPRIGAKDGTSGDRDPG